MIEEGYENKVIPRKPHDVQDGYQELSNTLKTVA